MPATHPGGYTGKILRVDLTDSRIGPETVPVQLLEKYIGGTGLGAKYLYDEVPPGVEWNSPANRIILATGPLTGTTVGGSGAFSLVTKGCLTNGATSTQAVGYLGAYLKLSGFDAIVVHGAASNPVYLYIHDGTAELRDAGRLWGKDTWQTEEMIKNELGKKEHDLSVFEIGPAGENLVKFACLVGDHGHVAAHNGVGAVFGAKKLKAIAVARGKGLLAIEDKQKFSDLSKQLYETVTSRSLAPYHLWGTLGNIKGSKVRAQMPIAPVKNYNRNFFPEGDLWNAEDFRTRYESEWTPCWACKFHHCHRYRIASGPNAGYVGEEPEYEGMVACTSLIGQTDAEEAFVICNELDRLGMDVNETGWVIAWVMDCYQRGLITKKDTGGLEMTWGNVKAVRQLIEKIARREGFGDILAEGALRASKHIGGEAARLAIYTQKGNTPRDHDHRASWVMLLDTCTSDTGSDADSALVVRPTDFGMPADLDTYSPDGAASLMSRVRGRLMPVDSLVVCRFNFEGGESLVPGLINAATGWNVSREDLRTFGLRVINLLRVFNLRHGISSATDAPSEQYAGAASEGPFKGITALPVWDRMLQRYYELMGWDKGGKPLPETLRRLGLEDVIRLQAQD